MRLQSNPIITWVQVVHITVLYTNNWKMNKTRVQNNSL